MIKKRLISLFLILSMILSLNILAYAEDNNYAEIVFGSSVKFTNISVFNYGFIPEVVKGRQCSRSDVGNEVIYVYSNIDDSFMFDLPNDTPVDITVEYFDGPEGKFNIAYDSNEPIIWDGSSDNKIYSHTDPVYLTNTMEWKTHTFHIEDLKAANRIGGSDFRLAMWCPDSGWSKKDVYFASLKVTYSEYLNPLKITSVGTDVVGNLMNEDSEINVFANCINKTEKKVNVKGSIDVFDSNDNLIEQSEEFSFSIDNKQSIQEKLTGITNPKKYGLYYAKGHFDISYDDKPDKIIPYDFGLKFSVSKTYNKDNVVREFGACNQVVGHGRGDADLVSKSMILGGMAFIRDDIGGGSNKSGSWLLPEANVERWRKIKENGVDIVGILFGPQCFGAWNIMPQSDSEIETYAKWAGDIARQLKGIVDYLEIWNEPNLTAFNANNISPATYAKICKASYAKIKEANPDAVVLGISSAAMDGLNIDYNWTKGIFEAGGLQYMDVLSIHPYEWSGDFRDELFIKSGNILHDLMKEYGGEKPAWITEFGFSTYPGNSGYTRKEQYQNHVNARALCKAYGLYDNYIMYCLCDRANRNEIEDNWGLLNHFDSSFEESTYSAKESFIAMCAYNSFIDDNTKLKADLSKDRVYLWDFYNSNLNKDVLLMQTGDEYVGGEITKSVDLGCNYVEVYDSYGNLTSTLSSETGVYTFIVDEEPCYVVGNFTKFENAEALGAVTTEKGTISAVGGDIIGIKLTKNISKDLKIKVSGLEVVENNGFSGNEAIVKVKIPSTKLNECIAIITAEDEEGNVYYARKHEINITDTVEVSFSSEQAMELSENYWYINAKIKNLGNTYPINGTFQIKEPTNVAVVNKTREIKNLLPGEEIVFRIKLPEKVNKNVINILGELKLDSGFTGTYTEKVNFTSAQYAYTKPKIDGNVDPGEWTGCWIGADELKDVRQMNDWNGPSDVSFSGNLMWDEENFYFMGIGVDDVHFVQYEGGVAKMWRADSFQIAFDDRDSVNPADKENFTEIGLGDVPGEGSRAYRTISLYDLPIDVLKEAEICVKRHENYTVYECRLPWSEIFYEGYKLNPDAPFRVSFLLNDNDGSGRGWIEYMAGIGSSKDATLFGELTFNK